MASGSMPLESEHATSVPSTIAIRGTNSFRMSGNMVLLAAARNCIGLLAAAGPAQRIALVHAAGIPQPPGIDAQLFSCADLLTDFVRRVTWLPSSQGERLQVGANHSRPRQRPGPLDCFVERVVHDAVRLAVRPREAVAAAVVMTGIHHRQHHIGDGDEIFPDLTDAEIAGC